MEYCVRHLRNQAMSSLGAWLRDRVPARAPLQPRLECLFPADLVFLFLARSAAG